MADVFLSYAREDRARAHMLASALEARGLDVWWDRDIPAGQEWAEVIEKAISSASCVVVLWSRHSVDSRWVHKEARFGDDAGVLVPVLLDDVDIPFEFGDIQAADLRSWRGGRDRQVERLVRWIGEVRRAVDAGEEPDPRRAPGRRRARSGVGSLGALVVLAGLGAVAFTVVDRDYWRMRFQAEGWALFTQLDQPPVETLQAASVCPHAAYLCATEDIDSRYLLMQRMADRTTPLVVRVPRPPVADAAAAARLQAAAVDGINQWNRRPFAIEVQRAEAGTVDVPVRWGNDGADGPGGVRTRWNQESGLTVVELVLSPHEPGDPSRLQDPARIRALAGHMMGHALGLPHSQDARDLMGTEFEARGVSARDAEAVSTLYRLPLGAVLLRW